MSAFKPVGGHQALQLGDFRKLLGGERKPFFWRFSGGVFFFSRPTLFLSGIVFFSFSGFACSFSFVHLHLVFSISSARPLILAPPPPSFFAAASFCCWLSSLTLVLLFLALSSPLVFYLTLFSPLLRRPILCALPVDRIFPNKPLAFFFHTAIGFWILLVLAF